MNIRKKELKDLMVSIIVKKPSGTLGGLLRDMAEALPRGQRPNGPVPELAEQDALWTLEVFHDLIIDKIITPGKDLTQPSLPYFRVHSEAPKS
jgi:hypothetical protein